MDREVLNACWPHIPTHSPLILGVGHPERSGLPLIDVVEAICRVEVLKLTDNKYEKDIIIKDNFYFIKFI